MIKNDTITGEMKASKLLLSWYDQNRRILPWREEPSPYHVWVSEIMLQQTRVEAVKEYYARFIQRLPDIESLANAKEDELLKLWEGLGYYSRVRNLQKAAKATMDQYGGELPGEYEELIKLPGIGSYTAGAISSIAFGKREAAVDGNVLRVLSRFQGDHRDIGEEKTKKTVREELLEGFLLPHVEAMEDVLFSNLIWKNPYGSFNQALMDLGAMVCVPNGAPKCMECPWRGECTAHKEGRELEFPVKKPKKARRIEEHTILLLQDQNKTALHKRPAKGLLARLYEYVNLTGALSQEEIRKWLHENGVDAIRITELPSSKHIFSHIEWHMRGYRVQVDELSDFAPENMEMQLVSTDDLIQNYAIPSAFRVYTEILKSEN